MLFKWSSGINILSGGSNGFYWYYFCSFVYLFIYLYFFNTFKAKSACSQVYCSAVVGESYTAKTLWVPKSMVVMTKVCRPETSEAFGARNSRRTMMGYNAIATYRLGTYTLKNSYYRSKNVPADKQNTSYRSANRRAYVFHFIFFSSYRVTLSATPQFGLRRSYTADRPKFFGNLTGLYVNIMLNFVLRNRLPNRPFLSCTCTRRTKKKITSIRNYLNEYLLLYAPGS